MKVIVKSGSHSQIVDGERVLFSKGDELDVTEETYNLLAFKFSVKDDPVEDVHIENIPKFELLVAAGYDSVKAIQAATDIELLVVDGIGAASLDAIRKAIQ